MRRIIAVCACLAVLGVGKVFSAEIIFVVDESGSMSGEHAWIGTMVTSLESELAAAGQTGNRYGLVGFGGGSSHIDGHKHLMSGNEWGTAAQLSSATSTLLITGGTEDGYNGITYALNNYTFTPGAAINIILVTDEDRDIRTASYTYNSVLDLLNAKNALLNVVVNATYQKGTSTALGIDSKAAAYLADGSGGYTTDTGYAFSSDYGTTQEDYINLAWATGGAYWNLNQLRAGGVTGQSFTEAFVDIKVQEIVSQVPESGATLGLFAFALAGLSIMRRRLLAMES